MILTTHPMDTHIDGKTGVGRVREEKKRRSEMRKSQKKEDAGAGKGRKVAIHGVKFQYNHGMISGNEAWFRIFLP